MITAEFEGDDAERWLKRAQGDVSELAERVTREAVALHQAQMGRNLAVRGRAVENRTGRLAGSLRMTQPRRTGQEYEATSNIGRGVPYARIQEKGGRITPKRRYLTVPLDTAKTAKGVTRKTAALVRGGRGFRTKGTVPGAGGQRTFIYQKGERKFVAVKRRGGGVLPLYILKKSVDIPGRLGFVKTWRDQKGKRKTVLGRVARAYMEGRI